MHTSVASNLQPLILGYYTLVGSANKPEMMVMRFSITNVILVWLPPAMLPVRVAVVAASRALRLPFLDDCLDAPPLVFRHRVLKADKDGFPLHFYHAIRFRLQNWLPPWLHKKTGYFFQRHCGEVVGDYRVGMGLRWQEGENTGAIEMK
jgi:hypothetical protein